jgi:predicted nucleic acid-binding protein
MPGLLSIDGPTAAGVIHRVFPSIAWLASDRASEMVRRLGHIGITGGSVYDALVGEAALSNGLRLMTRDLRARRTYDFLGVDFELVGF